MSAEVVRQVRLRIGAMEGADGLRVGVVDLRGSVLVADLEALVPRQHAMHIGAFGRLALAFVTSEVEADAYRRYAAMAAAKGYVRRVFTSVESASEWAAQEAALPPW